MQRCLNLTKAGEYAVSALARLALGELDGEARTSTVKELAADQGIPASFLAKIMAQCARAGLTTSRRGPDGGVRLSQPADRISLLSVIEACEGAYRRSDCVFYPDKPCDGPSCEVYCPLRREEEDLRSRLAAVTLADMARSLRKHPLLNRSGAPSRRTASRRSKEEDDGDRRTR